MRIRSAKHSSGNDAAFEEIRRALKRSLRPLRNHADLDPLLDRIGSARFVLIGEASHGTHEFYEWRDMLSRRLIEEKGFSFVAVEGDWPECFKVNRYVRCMPDSGGSAREVLRVFERWPTWMWANHEMILFADWLRRYNERRPEELRVGFYGLDVYSLWDSLRLVQDYLRKRNPAALAVAARTLKCFEPYGEDASTYARAARYASSACRDEVVELLSAVRRSIPTLQSEHREHELDAEQNALVVKNAENYYRSMLEGDSRSWNIRDRHMSETFYRLAARNGPNSRGIVWAHNSHVGDARHTDMAERGATNIGQLVREDSSERGVVLVGFGSHHGSVIAGREWDAPMLRMPVPPARPGSWEDLLHGVHAGDSLLITNDIADCAACFKWRDQRAIGVVYRPEYESYGNYVPSILPLRYDAFMFIDRSQALSPLRDIAAVHEELPETFPFGV